MKILLLFVVSVFTGPSDAIEVDPEIEEIEKGFIAELYEPLDRVLVCLNQAARSQLITSTDARPYILFEFPNINIEYHDDVGSCHREIEKDQEQTRTIIAVVTPKPFGLSSDVPMFFYDIPYLMGDDADAIPNGLAPLHRHWHWLKHAFTQHINSNGWKRIAIVSDCSPYSELFEKVLVEHFERNDFVYNVQRCVSTNTSDDCNFYLALQFLKNHTAVVIIANVEDRNAQNLANAAGELKMTSGRYVWLVRDWPFQDTTSPTFKRILSMSLSPKSEIQRNILNGNHDGPHYSSILYGLQLISVAVDVTGKKEWISEYYKSISQEMNIRQSYEEYKGYIRKYDHGGPKIINTLKIKKTGIAAVWGPGEGPVNKIADFEDHCMLRSNSYTSPCDDNWIMLICVVWLMFILMMFLIIFFFNRCLVWT